jgi:hypothetical protein
MRTPMLLLSGIVVVALSGCATSASASPTTSLTEASEPPASAPTPSSAGTSSVGPSPSASDEVGGLMDLTGAELFLASGIATEIRQSCERATDLPDGATAGLQCHPEGIAAIGFYLFDDRATMRDWYVARLAEFGVDQDSGEVCRDGSPGEGADNPGDAEFVNRLGCYVDGSGAANVRMAFPAVAGDRSVYVGAAGDSGSIDELIAALFPAREPGATGCNFCIGSIWSAARSD